MASRGGWGRRFKREWIFVHLRLIHIVVQQNPTQLCKAVILQLKINLKKKQVPFLYNVYNTCTFKISFPILGFTEETS